MIRNCSMDPLGDDEWPIALTTLRDSFATSLNVYRVMARHPPLLQSWTDLRDHIVLRSALGAERAEVVILRCGVGWNSIYEIAHHRHRAQLLGFSAQRISRLCGALDEIDGEDRLLADAVEDLIKDGRLALHRRDPLLELVGVAGVLDLAATVGVYATLAFITNSFSTPVDSAVEQCVPLS